jgi:hypothetical protein
VTRRTGRTQPCSDADAAALLTRARKFFEAAELVAPIEEHDGLANPAAALAVLAGIAAADAACCKALGRRSRGENHDEAALLLRQVEPGGAAASTALRRLLAVKDEAHYGISGLSGARLKTALRQTHDLIEFADAIIRR